MIISIIVAVAEGNVIGYKNKLPWYIPEDLKRFKKLTMGHHVIMGQKTYESIGKPLPGRKIMVLSDDPTFKVKGVKVARSIDQSLDIAKNAGEKEVFIAGGASVYKQFLPLADKIYLTKIHHKFKGDTFFPEINQSKWSIHKVTMRKKQKIEPFNYEFLILKRK